ncbi:MAG: YIP1 family protein [Kangiellaceae bacterium]|jgi:hypothetical protein|nr:YIP1 family protein [Kangiellaceae bacterium]
MNDQTENTTSNDTQDPGLIAIATDVFVAPEKAFSALKVDNRAWFPLVLTIALTIVSLLLFYGKVDFMWMMEQGLAAETDMSAAQKEEALAMYESMGTEQIKWFGLVAASIFIPIIFAIYGVYFLIVSNIRNDNLTYGQCFALSCWTNIVGLVSTLIGIVVIVLNDNGQIMQTELKGLNLNDLILQLEPGNPWYGWASNFDLAGIWAAVLAAIAYKTWTKASTTASYIIGFLPLVLIFGIWALRII